MPGIAHVHDGQTIRGSDIGKAKYVTGADGNLGIDGTHVAGNNGVSLVRSFNEVDTKEI